MNRDRQAGFTLIEVLAGLLILSLVLTTSLAVFFERERRLKQAEETILVWQVLANETELRRHVSFSSLEPGSDSPFMSDLTLLSPLRGVRTNVRVEAVGPGLKRLHLDVTWEPDRRAELQIHRTDLKGGKLW